MVVTGGVNGVALREPVNARGHRVLAHLCAEFARALVAGDIVDDANARSCVAVLRRRAHTATAKDAEDEATAERDTAAVLDRVLAG